MKDQPRFIIHSDGTIELCEDCISRQAVLDMVEDMTDQFGNKHRVVTEGMISLLPPVTPKPKEIYNKGWKDGAEATAYHVELCEEENPTIQLSVIEDIKADIAEFMSEIPALGNCKEGWHNAGQRIGLEQACEIIDNHIADMRKPERICDSCKYKGKSATIEMTTITRCHNPNVGVHEDDKRCEFYERGTE